MRGLEKGMPLFASLILHLTGLSVCAMVLYPTLTVPDESLSTIIGTMGSADSLDLTTMSFGEPGGPAGDQRDSGAESSAVARITELSAQPVNAAPRLDASGEFVFWDAAIGSGSLSEEVGAVASNSMTGLGTGEGSGTGGGGGFFGLDLKGHSAVFVVDASKSMLHPFPGPTKTRFGRVQMELLTTIGNMTESQRFFMVLFNEQAYPMPAPQMMGATSGAKQHYLSWLVNSKPDGKTDPEQALLIALQLRPEVIYFLTDGNFKYRVIETVSRANQGRVAINCVGFGDDEGEKFLKELATRNGGVYRFIPEVEGVTGEAEETPKTERPRLTSRPTLQSP